MTSKVVNYVVHGVARGQAPVQAEYEGGSLRAMAESLQVELIDPKGRHGSVTFRFVGPDVEEVESWISNGNEVTLTLAPKSEAKNDEKDQDPQK
jgi:hypothetical protein